MISQYFDPTNRPSFSTSSWPKLWEWVWDIPQVFTRSLSLMITRVRQQTNGLSVTVGQITEWFWNWITNVVIFMIWLVVATLMNWSDMRNGYILSWVRCCAIMPVAVITCSLQYLQPSNFGWIWHKTKKDDYFPHS